MRLNDLKKLTLCLFVLAMLMPGLAMADQLQMENGDVISGTVVRIEENKVFIKPTYTDEFGVNLDEVVSILSDRTFEVVLDDGSTLEGEFGGGENDQQTLVVDGDSLEIEVSRLISAVNPATIVIADPWEGTGELGFVNTTGNTETVALNMKLNFVRTSEFWRHRFSATALVTSEDGIRDNERYTLEVQSDRALNEKSWLFAAFRWDADKFGSYDPQISLTAGYGYQLMKSDRHELRAEIGGGYRKLTETVSRESNSEFIGRFVLDDWWQVFSSTRWTNRLLIETGASNTFTQFNTGLAISMTEKLGVKLGYEIRNNSEVPPGDSENTDTITSANLFYNF